MCVEGTGASRRLVWAGSFYPTALASPHAPTPSTALGTAAMFQRWKMQSQKRGPNGINENTGIRQGLRPAIRAALIATGGGQRPRPRSHNHHSTHPSLPSLTK